MFGRLWAVVLVAGFAAGAWGRDTLDLAGEWQLASVKTAVVATNGFDLMGAKVGTKKIVRDEPVDLASLKDWQKVSVPCSLAKVLKWRMSDENTCFLKRTFVTPEGWRTGGGVILEMERTGESFAVYVNGLEVARENAMINLCRRLDISKGVKAGTNELVVAVRKDGRRFLWQEEIGWYLTDDTVGITGPIRLEFTGGCYVRRAHVMTQVEPEKVLAVRVCVTNTTNASVAREVKVKVEGEQWTATSFVELRPGEEKVVELKKAWPEVHLWSPADPWLYNLDVSLAERATPLQDCRGKARSASCQIDAYRVRFGFREIKAKGHRMYLNGKPIILRKQTMHPGGDFATEDEIREGLKRLRRDGIVQLRVRWSEQERIAKVADEFGMLLEPCAYSTMAAQGRPDSYWRKYERYLLEMVDQLRNHPSIVDWAISNEFGTFYHGEGNDREEATTARQVHAGRAVAAADPTRVWTACGENELAYPARSAKCGPAPVRSVHYPFQVTADGHELPNAIRWYENGEIPWQGNGNKTKPLFISEDLYHGAQDSFRGLSKYAGDHHYDMEGRYGYFRTLAWIVRTYAEGYYFTGLGQWEPWCLFPGREPRVRFYDDGPVMPDYLFALKEFPRNLYAGEKTRRTLRFFNEWVTDVEGSLELRAKSEELSRETVSVLAGEFFEREIELTPPTGLADGADWPVTATFTTDDGRVLSERTFDFKVFRRVRAPDFRGVRVYAGGEDLKGVKRLVVTNVLSSAEGLELEKWVRRGGEALVFDIAEKSWSPVEIEYGKRATRVWRRMPDVMPGVAEETMQSWEPDGYPSLSAIRKPEEDADVLWDVGRKDGLTGAAICRVYRGAGSWTVCQMPLLSRWTVEPAAAFVLDALMDEFLKPHSRPSGALAVCDAGVTNNPISTVVSGLGIIPQSEDRAVCIVIDGADGLDAGLQRKILSDYEGGKTVLVFNLPANTDTNFLASLGIRLTVPAEVLDRKSKKGNGVKFVTHTDDAGLLDGVSNDDLFWWSVERMSAYTRDLAMGLPVEADDWRGTKTMYACSSVMEALPGSPAKICTRPGAWAEFGNEKGGRLVLSTLQVSACSKKSGAQVRRMMRRVLLNCGVTTSVDLPPHESYPIDIRAAANRNFWQDPLYRKPDGSFEPDGWFGGGNDLRYFPVNLCGWSLASAAYCPKEPMPVDPLKLGGVPFRMTDPLQNDGKGLIVVNPGKEVVVTLEKPVAADRIHFLGAFEAWAHPEGLWGNPPTNFAVDVVINDDDAPALTVKQGVHVGWFRMCNSPKEGRAAWTGRTPSDPTATLYRWTAPVPRPDVPVKKITLRHTADFSGLGVVAITAEKDVEL